MLIIFFDSQGVEHKKFVPEGKTVNAEFYKGVMDRLLKRIQRVRPAAFCSRDFFLLHDNAPAHKAASVCQFLTPKNVTTLYQPPYSPDLSPPDYFLLPKLKMKLKGLHSADVAVIQEAVTDELKKGQKEEFSAAFQKLYDRAKACIHVYANGAYFELKKGHVSSIKKNQYYNFRTAMCTHIPNMKYLYLFQGKNGCTNALECYVYTYSTC
jgi:histone-lysine N-methyltransferase SETMAR